MYDSWEDWARHEQWAHQRRVWRCSEHPQNEYVELASYEDHVKSYHTASKQQLLSDELLNYQESVSQVCDRPCPFCQREFERPIDLQQHIASHLESIALLSLPNLNNINEDSEARQVNSNSANRNYAESRAGDFDPTEPLVFLENDHTGDTPTTTDISNELFGFRLDSESVSFDSINEVSLEARQAYSSDLAGEWLSHLPRELSQEGPFPIEPLRSSSNLNYDSEEALAIFGLGMLCWKVYEKYEFLQGDQNSAQIVLLLQAIHKETEELSLILSLGTVQRVKGLVAHVKVCKDALMDLGRRLEKFESLGSISHRNLDISQLGTEDMDIMRSRLTWDLSNLRFFTKLYVESAHIFIRF